MTAKSSTWEGNTDHTHFCVSALNKTRIIPQGTSLESVRTMGPSKHDVGQGLSEGLKDKEIRCLGDRGWTNPRRTDSHPACSVLPQTTSSG